MKHVLLALLIAGCGPKAAPPATPPAPAPDCVCTEEYNPVCGVDGKTYGNACAAGCAKVAVKTEGACP